MLVLYKERVFIDKFKCIDKTIQTNVLKLAFTQGDLLYFQKDNFNYLVISKSDLIKTEDIRK